MESFFSEMPIVQPTHSDNMAYVLCGCRICKDHGVPMRGILDSCLKQDAYDAMLEERGFSRHEGKLKEEKKPEPVKEFKPASQEQINGWIEDLKKMKEFYETPEGKIAWDDRVKKETAKKEEAIKYVKDALESHKNYKFDVLKMEKHFEERVWRDEKPKFMETDPGWISYMHYGKEQNELLKAYESAKTDEAYDEISIHVKQHGQLIREVPKRVIKKQVKVDEAPAHMGRRAARRALVVEHSPIKAALAQ